MRQKAVWASLILLALAAVAPATMAMTFNEAPMLRELVEAGKLPPVEQRLPEDPLVVEPFDEIGRYGGEIRSGAFGPTSGGFDAEGLRVQNILQIQPDLQTLTPNIVRDIEIAEDFRSVKLYLRRGMKWSDGHPFTADDFMFWYEDILQNDDLTPVKRAVWMPGGELFQMTKHDDYTLELQFAAPYPAIDIVLAKSDINGRFFQPKHYLQKWHIKYNPEAETLARQEGFDSWWQAFNHHMAWQQDQLDVHQPTIHPWVLKSIDSLGNKYFERNPYYWKVDTAGNQLPYIDRQTRVLVRDAEVRILRLFNGELHVAAENPLPVSDLPLYKENEANGNYRTMLFENTRGADAVFALNLTHKDPVLREIFNDIRFRQALSLAIDRQQMNDIFYFGQAAVRQATAPPMTSFYEDWMGDYFAEYDPDRANALLDEMGLGWDRNRQIRLRSDGQPLQIVLETTEEFAPMAELVAEHWSAIGVATTMRQLERIFFYERGPANDRDAATWTFDSVSEFSMRSDSCARFRPTWGQPIDPAPLWQTWFNTGGQSGEEPPQAVKELYALCDEFIVADPDSERYKELGREILKRNVEGLYNIGTVVAPRVVMISERLGNTPRAGTFAYDFMFWVPYRGDQWYFKE